MSSTAGPPTAESITLHPQLSVLGAQSSQPGPLVAAQPSTSRSHAAKAPLLISTQQGLTGQAGPFIAFGREAFAPRGVAAPEGQAVRSISKHLRRDHHFDNFIVVLVSW